MCARTSLCLSVHLFFPLHRVHFVTLTSLFVWTTFASTLRRAHLKREQNQQSELLASLLCLSIVVCGFHVSSGYATGAHRPFFSTFSLSPHSQRQRRVLKVLSLKREKAQSIRKRKSELVKDFARESAIWSCSSCVSYLDNESIHLIFPHTHSHSHSLTHLTHRTHLYCFYVNVVPLMTWSHTRWLVDCESGERKSTRLVFLSCVLCRLIVPLSLSLFPLGLPNGAFARKTIRISVSPAKAVSSRHFYQFTLILLLVSLSSNRFEWSLAPSNDARVEATRGELSPIDWTFHRKRPFSQWIVFIVCRAKVFTWGWIKSSLISPVKRRCILSCSLVCRTSLLLNKSPEQV